MKKEHLTKVGIYLGVLMFTLVSGFAVWGADALPPRTVLLASTEGSVEAPEAPQHGKMVVVEPEAVATAECVSCGCGDEVYIVAPALSRVCFGGWLETGIYANSHGSTSKFDADGFIGNSGNSDRLGKLRSTGFQAQQAWLFAERQLMNDGYGFDWGFRVDTMIGTDGFGLQSWGDGSFDGSWGPSAEYAAAIPQMYAELGYNRWSLKLGKFISPIGYESVFAPEQMLYSHSYLYEHEPATHTGALLTFNYSENLSVFGGVTTGADTGFGNRYGDVGLLLGFNAQLTTKLNVGYSFMWNQVHGTGWNTDSGADIYYSPNMWDSPILGADTSGFLMGESGNEIMHSFVLEWQITCRLKYALAANYGNVRKTMTGGGDKYTMYEQFGVANYLEYQLTDKLSAAFRAEWFRQNANEMADSTAWMRQNVYSFTAGLNYSPMDWLIIRPEIRYDTTFGDGSNVFDGGNSGDQLMGGVGVIMKF